MISTRLNSPQRCGPALLILALFATVVLSQTTAPPTNYYASATGSGATLKSQLHNIIDNHQALSYNDMRSALQVTDRDPANANNILLIYDRRSLDLSRIGGSIPGWDSGNSWNREHTWPRALGIDSHGIDNSDLHMLRPSDTRINSDRGSFHFGGEFGQPFGLLSQNGTPIWYPGDDDAGMVARHAFYAAVRYDGSDSATDDLELADGTPSGSRMGDKQRLLEWHYAAAPDSFEQTRNHIIFDQFQGNRNPFVDHPEFAWSVFMDQENDSQLALQGTTIAPDGSSTTTIDFGRHLVDSVLPAMTTDLTIRKFGNDGTYYSVETHGLANASGAGRRFPMRMNGNDQNSLTATLTADSSTAGLQSGQVMFDNLDITRAGGPGRGAEDENDVAMLTTTILDHAQPSFDAFSQQLTLAYDFGNVALGDAPSFAFEIHNLEQTASFTSALDIDSVAASGDTVFESALFDTAPVELVAGEKMLFAINFDTIQAGDFSTEVTLSVSDEDLLGEQTTELTLTLTGSVFETATTLAGDYNLDGVVDTSDFTVWRDSLGSTDNLLADGDGNAIIEAADYNIWAANFGASQSPPRQAVPEPCGYRAVTLLSVIAMISSSRRSTRRLRCRCWRRRLKP